MTHIRTHQNTRYLPPSGMRLTPLWRGVVLVSDTSHAVYAVKTRVKITLRFAAVLHGTFAAAAGSRLRAPLLCVPFSSCCSRS